MLVYTTEQDTSVEVVTANGGPRVLTPQSVDLPGSGYSAAAVTGSEETYAPGAATNVDIPVPEAAGGDAVVVTLAGSLGSPLWVQGATVSAPGVVTAAVWNGGTDPLGPAAFNFNVLGRTPTP